MWTPYYFICLLVMLFACATLGCERKLSHLSTADWGIFSNTRFASAWIDLSDGTQIQFKENDPKFRKILKSLMPLTPIENPLGQRLVKLNYQAGMDPTIILVNETENNLTFQLGPYWYEGGKKETFKKLLSELSSPN